MAEGAGHRYEANGKEKVGIHSVFCWSSLHSHFTRMTLKIIKPKSDLVM